MVGYLAFDFEKYFLISIESNQKNLEVRIEFQYF